MTEIPDDLLLQARALINQAVAEAAAVTPSDFVVHPIVHLVESGVSPLSMKWTTKGTTKVQTAAVLRHRSSGQTY